MGADGTDQLPEELFALLQGPFGLLLPCDIGMDSHLTHHPTLGPFDGVCPENDRQKPAFLVVHLHLTGEALSLPETFYQTETCPGLAEQESSPAGLVDFFQTVTEHLEKGGVVKYVPAGRIRYDHCVSQTIYRLPYP